MFRHRRLLLYFLCLLVLVPTFSVTHAFRAEAPAREDSALDAETLVGMEDLYAYVKPFAQPAAQPSTAKKVFGYYAEYYSGDTHSYQSLLHNRSIVSDIGIVSLNASADGSLSGKPPASALTLARTEGISAYLLVTNHGQQAFDRQIAHAILTNDSAKNKLLNGLLDAVKQTGASGVNLDFENVPAADRDKLSVLVGDLADRLHQTGKKLIVSVPAKTADDPRQSWTYGYDYAAIGAKSDYVQMMTYDEHGPWMEAGPVASYPWVESCVRFAVSKIAAGKLLLGVPSYGYEWSEQGNRAIPYRDLPRLIADTGAQVQWSEAAKSPYLTYQKGNAHYTVWFENQDSLKAKRALADTYGLAGFSVWRLGLEDQTFWKALLP